MKRFRIKIMIGDKVFARRFAEALGEWFDVMLCEYGDNSSCDFLITDIESIPSDMYLCWDRLYDDERHIYAFDGIDMVRRKILHVLNQKGKSDFLDPSHLKIYTVLQPCGGMGASTFSLALAECLEGNSLYVTFDDYPYCDEVHAKDAPMDINRYMFEVLDENKRFTPSAVTYEDMNGIFHVRYRKPFNLFNLMEAADMASFLSSLENSEFNNIVIDMGNRTSMSGSKALELSSKVFMLDSVNGQDNVKCMEYFESFFEGETIHVHNHWMEEHEEKGYIPHLEDEGMVADVMKVCIEEMLNNTTNVV